MGTGPEKRRKRRVRAVAVPCALSVVAYPLSFGPATWAATRGSLPDVLKEAVGFLYYPLIYLMGTDGPLGELVRWYVLPWIGPM